MWGIADRTRRYSRSPHSSDFTIPRLLAGRYAGSAELGHGIIFSGMAIPRTLAKLTLWLFRYLQQIFRPLVIRSCLPVGAFAILGTGNYLPRPFPSLDQPPSGMPLIIPANTCPDRKKFEEDWLLTCVHFLCSCTQGSRGIVPLSVL